MPTMRQCLERLRDNYGPDAKFEMNANELWEERRCQTLGEWLADLDARGAPEGDSEFGLDFRSKNVFLWAQGQDRKVDATTARDTCVMFNADFDASPSVATRNPTLTWKPAITAGMTVIPKLVKAFSSYSPCNLDHAELVQLLSAMSMFGMGRPLLPGAQGVVPKLFAQIDVHNGISLQPNEVQQLMRASAAFGMVMFAKQEDIDAAAGSKRHSI